MGSKLRDVIPDLAEVRSLIALLFAGATVVALFTGYVKPEDFITLVTTVIGFVVGAKGLGLMNGNGNGHNGNGTNGGAHQG